METTDPKYKHKPSEKHTLEEVLKSLQDLIRNDLAEGAAAAGKAPAAPPGARRREAARETGETKTRHENTSMTREDFAPASPGSGPVNLNAVMRSLKDLIGNELNVGDEPKPPAAKAAHEEYLASEERIEEYIPEELGQLGNELNLGEELAQEEPVPAPPPDVPPAPQDNIEASLPEGFAALEEELMLEELAEAEPLTPPLPETPELPEEISLEAPPAPEKTEASPPQEFNPLDEELTLEELAEAESLAPPLPETPQLHGEISLETPSAPEKLEASLPQEFNPLDEELTLEELAEAEPLTPQLSGEISPTMRGHPEVTPPPAVPEAPRALDDNIAPGAQQEMFFEEPPVPSRESETAPAAAVSAPEPGSTLELVPEPVVEPAPTPAETTALPTIEVEESTEANAYFDAPAPSPEAPPTPLEEIAARATEISVQPEQPSPPIESTPSTAAEPPATPEPPPAPVKKKITLEIVDGPIGESPMKTSVDFDAMGLAPSTPEPTPPPVVAEIPAPQTETPVTAAAPEASPATNPEPPKAAEVAPAAETKAKAAPEPVKPPAPTEPKTTETPPVPNLDDLPVLSEIVAPPVGSVPAAKSDTPPPRPAPDRARDIVVRAVAKLNVELRKRGGTGLDTKTILRLQQLIRQELEKGGEK